MKKINAMKKVLKGKGKYIAVNKRNGNIINYGAGQSLRINFGAEFVCCYYMNTDRYKVIKNNKNHYMIKSKRKGKK